MNEQSWRDRLADLERLSPWRPQPIEAAKDLVGRERDLEVIISKIQARPLLAVFGQSGVGKTSLYAKLKPLLETGYYLIICDRWASLADDAEPQSPDRRGDEPVEVMQPEDAKLSPDRREFERQLVRQVTRALALDEKTVEDWWAHGFWHSLKVVVGSVTGLAPLLVLDQFEEFLRTASPNDEKDFSRCLSQLISQGEPMHVVVSLRSEYWARLQALVRPLSSSGKADYYELRPIADLADISEIIRGVKNGRPIAESAATKIADLWRTDDTHGSPGLVALNALLYTLYWRANPPGSHGFVPNKITEGLLKDYLNLCHNWAHTEQAEAGILANRSRESSEAEKVARRAYFDMVATKLRNCAVAMTGDPLVADVTPQVLAQIHAMHSLLATGGFKDYRRLDRLFVDANLDVLQFVLGRLGSHEAQDALNTPLRNTLDSAKERDVVEVLHEQLDHPQWVSDQNGIPVVGLDTRPWREDSAEVTSGPWLGLSPDKVLMHLARMFVMAVQWLEHSNLCRVSWERPESISLAHDQLAEALRLWGSEYADDNERLTDMVLTSPVATLGRRLDLEGAARLKGLPHKPAVICDVRLPRNQIIADMQHLLFVNCDFRNTRFTRCIFDGVAFVNCSLDGALFEDCAIVGSPDSALVVDPITETHPAQFDEVWASRFTGLSAPKFQVRIAREQAIPLLTLRGYAPEVTSHWLLSVASGAPAIPVSDVDLAAAPEHIADALSHVKSVARAKINLDTLRRGAIAEARAPSGGLALIGGRVASLTFARTMFLGADREPDPETDRGALTLTYASGSSVEFVEHNQLHLAIDRCAIRGLAVTRPVDAETPSASSGIYIGVDNSVLVNTWIGANIRGRLTARDTTLQAVTSLSGEHEFVIDAPPADNSNQAFCDPRPPEAPSDKALARGLFMVQGTEQIGYKTSFRSQPAQAEYEVPNGSAPPESSQPPVATQDPPAGSRQVFISYSHLDEKMALAALDALEKSDLLCWIAPRDEIAGLDYYEQIWNAIRAASVVILVSSGNSNASVDVVREIYLAAQSGKVILPYYIDDAPLHSGLSVVLQGIQRLVATSDDPKHDALVKSVHHCLESKREAPALPASPVGRGLADYRARR